MSFLSKYGVARHVYIAIPKAGSANHAVSADWTPAAGDVKISKDGGAAANVTNLPTAIAMGNSTEWDFHLTATEMEAAQVVVTIADSATKAVDDTGFIIETYGNASAQHAFDLDTASTAQTGDAYAVVNSGTHGNAALKALIDAVDDLIDTEVADIRTRVLLALPAVAMGNAGGLATYSDQLAMQSALTTIFNDMATEDTLGALVTTVGVAGLGLSAIPKAGYKLASDGLDSVLIEAVISASAALVNDSGTQLTSINVRQALSLILAAAAAKLSGAEGATLDLKPAGKPSASSRVTATCDTDGNRTPTTVRVPD